MTNALIAPGITIATDAVQQSAPIPTNLAELLLLVDRKRGTQESMLHAVAARFLEYVGAVAADVSIETLDARKAPFVAHLRTSKYKPASIKSYRNYLNVLIRVAEAAGWKRPKVTLPPQWQPIADALPRRLVKHILCFAVRIGKTPETFSEDDLKAWRQERALDGYSHSTAEDVCTRFRTSIKRAGLSTTFPLIGGQRDPYGVPLRKMHPQLRLEIEELLEWKLCDFQLDRPSRARIRPITAMHLADFFCLVVGYVQNIERQPEITTISALVTRDNIARFTMWVKNKRKVSGQTLCSRLGMMLAAIRQNPRYKILDLDWFPSIIKQIPLYPQSAIDERKAQKYVDYSTAEQIPMRIRAQRLKMKPATPYALAISARDELLTTWLIVLAWRQRNIRECRIAGARPNLFKAPISPYSMATKPAWVAEQERISPGITFWQFHFVPEETKTKHDVRAFLPSDLVPLLDGYISLHRPILLGDNKDPGTLFFTENGTPFEVNQFTDLVKRTCAAHTGVAVTPHLYRDIVAFEWLRTHPEDYLTVSKLLWHRNITTTLKKYARRFDESTGTARMDEWRSERSKKAT